MREIPHGAVVFSQTRVIARFDLPGRFVWHCHIVEHGDNDMMRPYEVVTG